MSWPPTGPSRTSTRPDFATAANTLVWVDRQGREEPLAARAGPHAQPRVSPDGLRVAVVTANEIWVLDLARQSASQLTIATGPNFAPVWTRDGDRLLFFSALRESGLFWQAADGTGAAERLGAGLPSGVTPDGKQVLFSSVPGARDLMVLTLDASHHAEPLIQTPSTERNGVVSPDGRWLAYESDSSGQFEIYVTAISQRERGVLAGFDGGWHAAALGAERPGAVLCGARGLAHGRSCRRSRCLVEGGRRGKGRRGALLDRRQLEQPEL